MSSLIAAGGATQSVIVTNDGFFPDIDLKDCRDQVRLDGTITDLRLTAAVTTALLTVNAELATYKSTQLQAGYTALTDVPGDRISGQSKPTLLYKSAVYSLAKAELVERYRDYDSTLSGHQRAEQLEGTDQDYRRDARWAIRDLLGRRRTTVELI